MKKALVVLSIVLVLVVSVACSEDKVATPPKSFTANIALDTYDRYTPELGSGYLFRNFRLSYEDEKLTLVAPEKDQGVDVMSVMDQTPALKALGNELGIKPNEMCSQRDGFDDYASIVGSKKIDEGTILIIECAPDGPDGNFYVTAFISTDKKIKKHVALDDYDLMLCTFDRNQLKSAIADVIEENPKSFLATEDFDALVLGMMAWNNCDTYEEITSE